MSEELQLTEAFTASGGEHDPDAGIVYGVKILGLQSRNRKRYASTAVRDALPLIESAASYIDHTPDADDKPLKPAPAKPPRSVKDRFGSFENVRQDNKGEAFGDYRYPRDHWFAGTFRHLVDTNAKGVGFSIVGKGVGSRQPDGTVLVEKITAIHSVDFVDDPATCVSLREQTMDPALDPMTGGTVTGDDWKVNCCDTISAVAKGVADGSIDKGTARKKIMALLKLLDDGDGDTATATDAAMMEQFREEVATPAGRRMLKIVGEVQLKEQRQARKEQAVKAGIAEIHLSEQFLTVLNEAPADRVPQLIEDRKKLIASFQKPVSPVPSQKVDALDPWNLAKPGTQAPKITELREKYYG